jgi:phosphomannomutase
MSETDTDPIATDVLELARAWIEGDPDPATRDELQALLDADDRDELADRLGMTLEFGTAGLRGIVGAGSNRMNRAVVTRTSKGLADHLLATVPDAAERGVVVGFDARLDSEAFARIAVGVFAAAGLQVRWFPTPQPTPLVAYTQRVLDAAAAVVITASHNPPEYNGYKVYAQGAAQIVPPTDALIAAAIAATGPATEIAVDDPLSSDRVAPVDAAVVDRYFAELITVRPTVEGPDLPIVYTPLHGVAGELVQRALHEGGYADVHVVPSQAEPDGRFPTVRFPNPEERGAMDAALALADEVGAELVIANDPDGDRLAAAIPDGAGGYRMLSGNQIGVLLTDHLLRGTDVERPLVVASIVSTPMFADVARSYGAHAEWTLTGFKWICAAARDLEKADGYTFVYGFEEALGSSVGTVVRDKDGIGAAAAFADLARSLKAEGRTILDRLEELYRTHGLWVSHQHSITRPGMEGLAEIARAMTQLETEVPAELGGEQVLSSTDFRVGAEDRPPWLEAHDLVVLELTDGRALIRPSGTEPKLKIYVDLRGELREGETLDTRADELQSQAVEVARDLAGFVGLD